jgi:hypothetical protein
MLLFLKVKVQVTCIVIKIVNLGRWKLVRTKLLVGLLITVFIFSAFSVALAATKCPRCNGTGKITVDTPQESQANVVLKRTLSGEHSSLFPPIKTSVKGIFHNEGEVGVYGTVTGQIKTPTATFTNTTSGIYFPPNEDVTVTVPITVEGTTYAQTWAYFIQLSDVGNAGTGSVATVITCPDCGGTGVLSESLGGSSNIEQVGGDIGGVAGIVAGVAVVGAVIVGTVFVVKKKRVTEESLRRLSSFEFQDWVAKRLGSSSTQKGSYLGIDGFTAEGYPFQVRQEDDVGKRAIDIFAAAVGRSKARSGTIVAFSFGRDSFEAVTRAKLNSRLEIKTVTVRELMASEKRTL